MALELFLIRVNYGLNRAILVKLQVYVLLRLNNVLDAELTAKLVVNDKDFVKIVGFNVAQ
jgi:hypothetical protein